MLWWSRHNDVVYENIYVILLIMTKIEVLKSNPWLHELVGEGGGVQFSGMIIKQEE